MTCPKSTTRPGLRIASRLVLSSTKLFNLRISCIIIFQFICFVMTVMLRTPDLSLLLAIFERVSPFH